jgi:hypothetical protein
MTINPLGASSLPASSVLKKGRLAPREKGLPCRKTLGLGASLFFHRPPRCSVLRADCQGLRSVRAADVPGN